MYIFQFTSMKKKTNIVLAQKMIHPGSMSPDGHNPIGSGAQMGSIFAFPQSGYQTSSESDEYHLIQSSI